MADRDVELIEGQLSASVMLQDVTWGDATIPCWTAVTRDLRSVGQAEIAICLVRDGDDPLAFPPRILAFFKAVHGLAREGRFVGPGDLPGSAARIRWDSAPSVASRTTSHPTSA